MRTARETVRAALAPLTGVEALAVWWMLWMSHCDAATGKRELERVTPSLGRDLESMGRVLVPWRIIGEVFDQLIAAGLQDAGVLLLADVFAASRRADVDAVTIPCPDCGGRKGRADALGFVERSPLGIVHFLHFASTAPLREARDLAAAERVSPPRRPLPVLRWYFEDDPSARTITCRRGHTVTLRAAELTHALRRLTTSATR